MTKFFRILTAVLIIAFSGALLFGQQRNPAEGIKISGAVNSSVVPGGSNNVTFTMTVPESYHLYLDHINPSSYSILMKVSLGDVSGVRLLEIVKPAGEPEGDDMVLRSKGEITLKLSMDNSFQPGDTIALPLQIYSQLCNDDTKVCYPPYTAKRYLALSFDGKEAEEEKEEYVDSSEISWISTIAEGRTESVRTGKPMFVFITAPSWCGACMSMEEYTLPDSSFISFINKNFVPVFVPDEKNGDTNRDLFEYEFGWAYPSYLIVSSGDNILYRDAGFASAEQLIGELQPYTDDSEEYEDAEDTDWGGFTYAEMLEMQENYIKNHARQYTKISTAAFLYSEDVGCAILQDGRFVFWSLDDTAQVIEGYPKSIQEYWPDLYPYQDKVISALTLKNGKYYIFLNDGSYLRFTYGTRALDPEYPKPVNDTTWPGLGPYAKRIQASFQYPARNKAYFFLDRKEYLRYDVSSDSLDPGYPKAITEATWPGMEAYARIILSALNAGGDISFIFTDEANMMEFSHILDEVVRY